MNKFSIIIFSIVLMGNPLQWQLDIATKYDNVFYRDIEVIVTDNLACQSCVGYNEIIDDKWGDIKVLRTWDMIPSFFEETLIHELVHHTFQSRDEQMVDRITTKFIKYANKS